VDTRAESGCGDHVGDPLAVASFVPVDDQSVTVYVLLQLAGR